MSPRPSSRVPDAWRPTLASAGSSTARRIGRGAIIVFGAALAIGSVPPARATAQFVQITQAAPAAGSPGPNWAVLTVQYGGRYGTAKSCDTNNNCAFYNYDYVPSPDAFQFTVNGVRQERALRVTGPGESCTQNADGTNDCTRTYTATNGRFVLPPNATTTLLVQLAAPNAWASQSWSFGVSAADRARPLVSLRTQEELNRDVGRCVLACFDAVASVSTPTYTSRDVAHGVSLVYRSNRGRGTLTLDATDPSTTPADRLSVQLYTDGGQHVTWDNGSTELHFTPAPGRTTRLVGTFGGWGPPTGVLPYEMTAVVTHYWNDGTALTTEIPVRLVIEGQLGSAYGAGWNVAGVRMIRFDQSASRPKMAVWDGTGSTQVFDADCPYGRPYCKFYPPSGVAFYPIVELPQDDAYGAHMYQTFPDGSAAGYAGSHQVYSVDQYGARTTFQWLDDDHLLSITDPAGLVTRFEYDGANHLSGIVDPMGRRTRVQIDGNGDLVSAWDPLGQQATYAYRNHRLTQYTQAGGGTWDYAYDAAGKLLTTTAPAIQTNAGTQRPVTRTQSAEGRVLAGTGAGQGTQSSPMPGTAPGAATALVTDAANNTTTYLLDRFGQPSSVQLPNGALTTVETDEFGSPTRVLGANGHDVRAFYNPMQPQLVDSTWDVTTGRHVRYAYDGYQSFLGLRSVTGDVTSIANTWWNNRLVSTQVGDGPVTKYFYGHPNDTRPDSTVDQNGHTTAYTYASNGFQNTVSVWTTGGGATNYAYDGYGRLRTVTNPRGDTTHTDYDALNRVVATVDGLGYRTQQGYNALYPTAVTDANNAVYRHQVVDALGNPQDFTDPTGKQTTYSYDAANRLWQITDRRGQILQFVYDPVGNVTNTYVSDGAAPTFVYDPNGHYVVSSNREVTDTTFYDNAGQKVREVHNFPALLNAGRTGAFAVTSLYDVQGRRTTVLLGAVRRWDLPPLQYRFNALGQLDTIVDYAGQVTTIAYNGEGALLKRTLPGSIGDVSAMPTALHEDGGMHLTTNANLDGVFGTRLRLDSLGRIVERVRTGPQQDGPQQGPGYQFDRAGRLTGVSAVSYSADPGTSGCKPVYGASGIAATDLNEQPTGYNCPPDNGTTRTETPLSFFSYDAVGNPTDAGAQMADQANRLAVLNGQRYYYDAAGNRWMHTDVNGTWMDRPAWNILGQMTGIAVYNPQLPNDSVDFGYDALGRRVRKTSVYAGRTTYYVWDGDHVAAEIDGNGNPIAAYAYYPGVDRPHSARVAPFSGSDRTYYYVQGDAPGNVLGLVDANANVAATYQVDVWGQPTAISEPGLQGWAQPYLFAGRAYDRETGLYYNRARYYDPIARRFLSEDPAGLAGGMNLYAYAGNDPVNYSDPSGLDGCKNGQTEVTATADDGTTTTQCVSNGGSPGGVPLPGVTSTGTQTPPSLPPSLPFFPSCLTCGSAPPFGPGIGGPGGGTAGVPASAQPAQPTTRAACRGLLTPAEQMAGQQAYDMTMRAGRERAVAVVNNALVMVPRVTFSNWQRVETEWIPTTTTYAHGHLKMGPTDSIYGSLSPRDESNVATFGAAWLAYSIDSLSIRRPGGRTTTCAR